jgi:hypothetical protein
MCGSSSIGLLTKSAARARSNPLASLGYLQAPDPHYLRWALPPGVAAPAEPPRPAYAPGAAKHGRAGVWQSHTVLRLTPHERARPGGAHKTMLLAAVAFNLKKLLNHRSTQQVSAAVALPRPLLAANRRSWRRYSCSQAPTQALEEQLVSKEAFYRSSSATATVVLRIEFSAFIQKVS